MNRNEKNKKNVLMLGGTGAIGEYLIGECIKLGYRVTVTTRNPNYKNRENLIYIIGNAKNKIFLKQLSSHHFDAVIDFMNYSTAEFKSNVSLLFDLANQYIFVSSYRVFADQGLEKLYEDSPRLLETVDDSEYLKTDDYALAKARQEDIILHDFADRLWTIVRPSITYSSSRFQLGALETNTIIPRAALNLPVPIPEEMMGRRTTMTWAGDVAKMIALLINNVKAYNEIFNTLTNENRIWADIVKIYEDTIGMDVRTVALDDYINLGIDSCKIKYDRMYDRICSNDKIKTVLGLKDSDFMSPESGLSFELRKLYSKRINTSSVNRVNGRLDRILSVNRLPKTVSIRYFSSYLVGRYLDR